MLCLISFRYENKTAALNKCMILCLLFIFKKLCLFTSTVSVSETTLSSPGLSHGSLDCKTFVEGFLLLCLRIAAAMNSSDPISLCYNDLCCVLN